MKNKFTSFFPIHLTNDFFSNHGPFQSDFMMIIKIRKKIYLLLNSPHCHDFILPRKCLSPSYILFITSSLALFIHYSKSYIHFTYPKKKHFFYPSFFGSLNQKCYVNGNFFLSFSFEMGCGYRHML